MPLASFTTAVSRLRRSKAVSVNLGRLGTLLRAHSLPVTLRARIAAKLNRRSVVNNELVGIQRLKRNVGVEVDRDHGGPRTGCRAPASKRCQVRANGFLHERDFLAMPRRYDAEPRARRKQSRLLRVTSHRHVCTQSAVECRDGPPHQCTSWRNVLAAKPRGATPP